MGKLKSKSWSPRPSTTQSGVLNYSDLTAKKRRLTGKTKKRRAIAKDMARTNDALRQCRDMIDGVDFQTVQDLLRDNPQLTLERAKEMSRGKQ